jgi:hypothetical protein
MGCGASKTHAAKQKKSNAGQGQPNQTQQPNTAITAAARTREYYRNSLGNDFIEGFSRTGETLSRKNTMRSTGSLENVEIAKDLQNPSSFPAIKDEASNATPVDTIEHESQPLAQEQVCT